MEDFNVWFCLKDRMNFTIDPQINPDDSQFYFGRDDIKKQLQNQIRRSFIAPGTPKMMVYGPYGSGKTQTLFYLERYLKTDTPISAKGNPHTVYLTVEMSGNSTAANLHMQLMEALGKENVSNWVRNLFDSNKEFDKILFDIVDDPNIFKSLKELRATGDSTFNAWRWLTGQSLTGKDLSNLQITRNLGDLGSGDLVKALVAIGNLAGNVNEKIIYLIDEMEQLLNVKTGDSTESIQRYLRKLSDPANASVGFLIGFKADVIDDAPEILRRGDIYSRIGASNYLDIPHLPAVSDVKAFISELLTNLTDKNEVNKSIESQDLKTKHGIFPFEQLSIELLADYAAQDPTRALPRYIITAINECAIQAWDDEKQLIDEKIINEVAPHVFQ